MVRVQLAVYDLSRGMAAAMSQQILGERIDAIYHTGIVVFSREYYFGGGVQVSPLGAFSQAHGIPCTFQDMGETIKTQQELEAFLRSISPRFTATTYNLIQNNCNHFSNEICQFLTGRGIPSEIVNLPQRVFSTPGGQALRPLFESMMSGVNGGAASSGLDPFGGGLGQRLGVSAQAGMSPQGFQYGASVNTPFYSGRVGNLPAPAPTPAPAPAPTSAPASAVDLSQRPPAPVLEEHPLLSVDASAVTLLGNKLLKGPHALRDADVAALRGLMALVAPAAVSAANATPTLVINGATIAVADAPLTPYDPASHVEHFARYFSLLQALLAVPASQMTALFLARLLLVKTELPPEADVFIAQLLAMLQTCDPSIAAQPPSPAQGSVEPPSIVSKACLVMAVCCLANWMSHARNMSDATREGVLDAALRMAGSSQTEVRQIALVLAYNLCLHSTRGGAVTGHWANQGAAGAAPAEAEAGVEAGADGDGSPHPHAVQLLCLSLEAVEAETDPGCRRRRLCTGYRILWAYSSSSGGGSGECVQLARDIGFREPCEALLAALPPAGPAEAEAHKERLLLHNLLYLLQ